MSESSPPMPQSEPSPTAGRFARLAAVSSLLASFAAIFIYVVLFGLVWSHVGTNLSIILVIGLLPLLLIVAGLVLGVIALVQTKKHGRRGIFGKAIAGVCINGLLLVLVFVFPLLLTLALGLNHSTTPQGRLDEAIKKLTAASREENKFYALDDAAKESFEVGKIEDASKYALELLAVAPKFPKDWNYGNAIQDGNLVLGRIAVRKGRIEEAKQYLLAAGKSPGSPQMNSFGPNMSLAKDLLEKGERDVVLQHFELCRKFWKMDYGKLNLWSQEVKDGGIPNFGANLVY